ncbi:MAG: acetyltransferase [Deltaproteobacteria bacterium]|nr:acetyltransferase [Deltaproteobacteria bacterium]
MEIHNVVIWGASGHSLVAADILRLMGQWKIVGFLSDVALQHGQAWGGATVLGDGTLLRKLVSEGVTHAFIAVGSNPDRRRLAQGCLDAGLALATAVHPRAIVAGDVKIGPGSMVAGGAILNPGTVLSSNVIVNTGAIVDHECMLAAGVHVGPGCQLGGCVQIGEESWIGIGASIIHQRKIGARTIVGAGAVVVEDLPADVVAYGVPARVARANTR